jgi:hypothetical protein
MGRVLADGPTFRCADCGAECRGGHEGICGCGIRPLGGTVRAGQFVCAPNPRPSRETPRRIGIAFVAGAVAAIGEAPVTA